MLEYHLDRTSGILSLEPRAPLTARDFDALSLDVDGYLTTHNTLAGIVLSLEHVPGWANLTALLRHMRFVANHHERVCRIAVLTNNALLRYLPKIAGYIVDPEFHVFESGQRSAAINWINSAKGKNW